MSEGQTQLEQLYFNLSVTARSIAKLADSMTELAKEATAFLKTEAECRLATMDSPIVREAIDKAQLARTEAEIAEANVRKSRAKLELELADPDIVIGTTGEENDHVAPSASLLDCDISISMSLSL